MTTAEKGQLIIDIVNYLRDNHRIWGFDRPRTSLATLIRAIAIDAKKSAWLSTYLAQELKKMPTLLERVKPYCTNGML